MRNGGIIKKMKESGMDVQGIARGEYLVIKTEDFYKICRKKFDEEEG